MHNKSVRIAVYDKNPEYGLNIGRGVVNLHITFTSTTITHNNHGGL